MSERHFEVFQTKLRFLTRYLEESIDEYLGVHSEFILPDKDIFGNYTFGYGRCGYIDIEDGEVYFKFELQSGSRVGCISMTIRMLLQVLNYLLFSEEVHSSDRWQFIQIDTICRNDIHGHSMGGWISPDLGMWLKKQGERLSEEDTFSRIRLPLVEEVMRKTWNKITSNKLKRSENECRATIACDGRFNLMCSGDACEVAIYPDQLYGDVMGVESVQFTCHNLDAAVQQITLLAGIAKLCELARDDK